MIKIFGGGVSRGLPASTLDEDEAGGIRVRLLMARNDGADVLRVRSCPDSGWAGGIPSGFAVVLGWNVQGGAGGLAPGLG